MNVIVIDESGLSTYRVIGNQSMMKSMTTSKMQQMNIHLILVLDRWAIKRKLAKWTCDFDSIGFWFNLLATYPKGLHH